MTDDEANKLIDAHENSVKWENVDVCIMGHKLHIISIKFHENKTP